MKILYLIPKYEMCQVQIENKIHDFTFPKIDPQE